MFEGLKAASCYPTEAPRTERPEENQAGSRTELPQVRGQELDALSSFQRLPDLAWQHIAHFSSLETLGALAQVDRNLQIVMQDPLAAAKQLRASMASASPAEVLDIFKRSPPGLRSNAWAAMLRRLSHAACIAIGQADRATLQAQLAALADSLHLLPPGERPAGLNRLASLVTLHLLQERPDAAPTDWTALMHKMVLAADRLLPPGEPLPFFGQGLQGAAWIAAALSPPQNFAPFMGALAMTPASPRDTANLLVTLAQHLANGAATPLRDAALEQLRVRASALQKDAAACERAIALQQAWARYQRR